jgi:hypothetical protein
VSVDNFFLDKDLNTKVFVWYLSGGVVLTKDNLVKCNWHGSTNCVFCHHDETIEHLFLRCKLAKSTWSVIQVGSTLYLPCSVANIYGNWLNSVDIRFKILIRVEVLLVICLLWLCKK